MYMHVTNNTDPPVHRSSADRCQTPYRQLFARQAALPHTLFSLIDSLCVLAFWNSGRGGKKEGRCVDHKAVLGEGRCVKLPSVDLNMVPIH